MAIAEAVTEFSRIQRETIARDEVQRLGALAHELRNALANATTAFQLIETGVVGCKGSTSRVLVHAHARMTEIIDRSLAEVRLQGESQIQQSRCRLVDLVGEVESTATFESRPKFISLREVPAELMVTVDRHLLLSAISNLVQNAIKFSHEGATVIVRARRAGERILVDVVDQCGGLPRGTADELFKPFTQKSKNRSGLGLGLAICQRAVKLNGGNISVRDMPGRGCVFTIDLPATELDSYGATSEGPAEGIGPEGAHLTRRP